MPIMVGFKPIFDGMGSELLCEKRAEIPIDAALKNGWRISIIRLADHPLSPATEDFLDCPRIAAKR